MGFAGWLTKLRQEIVITSASFLVYLTPMVQSIFSSKETTSRIKYPDFLEIPASEVGLFFKEYMKDSQIFLKKVANFVGRNFPKIGVFNAGCSFF